MAQSRYTVKISEKKEIAPDVIELRCEKPPGFDFDAGEFVRFVVHDEKKEVLRAYSICSAPNDDYLEFLIKLIDGGVASRMIRNISKGDTLSFEGPMGRFKCKDGASAHHFIATGVGIAPIMSMIKDQLGNNEADPLHLLFGLRNERDIFWRERLDALQSKHPRFSYEITLSQPSDDWEGISGRVTEHLMIESDAHYYLCGSGSMVKDVRNILLDKKVDAGHIHFEIF